MPSKTTYKRVKWGDDVTDRLYKAAVAYIKKYGGTSVVIGGLAIVDEGVSPNHYGLIVRVLGTKPEFPSKPNKKMR